MSAPDAGAELPRVRHGVDPAIAPVRRFSAARTDRPARPSSVFDPGLQHERTALAWERTAISSMVAGVLLARYAASSTHFVIASVGIGWVIVGALVLLWSGRHYDELHGPLRAGESPVHPTAARILGLATIVFSGCGLLLSIMIAIGI